MIGNVRDATETNAREQWLKTGQAELASKMQGEHDISTLATNIATYLGNYLDVPVGVFYVADTKGTMHLTGSYAYDHRKHQGTTIEPGVGVLGQAVLEKKTMVVSGIPKDYISVNSGLAEVTPNHVLVSHVLLGEASPICDLKQCQYLSSKHSN